MPADLRDARCYINCSTPEYFRGRPADVSVIGEHRGHGISCHLFRQVSRASSGAGGAALAMARPEKETAGRREECRVERMGKGGEGKE